MKRIVCIMCAVLTFSCAFAQTDSEQKQDASAAKPQSTLRHYLEISGNAGVTSFVGNPTQGYFAPSYNAGLGFYYIMRSMKAHVGLRTGLSAQTSENRFMADNYTDTYATEDLNNNPMDVTYTLRTVDEKINQVYFTIPLQFSAFGNNFNFHIGPQISIPLFDYTRQNIYNGTLSCSTHPNDPNYSSGMIERQELTVKNDKVLPKVWIMLASEISYDVVFAERFALNFGIYADYALNSFSVETSNQPSLLTLQETQTGSGVLTRTTTSALRAQYKNQPLIDKFGYFSAGLKIALKMWE